ncbi:hypothetical protein K474DRAFT_1657199 [Panus rudis PR-1116 ss-1]|nr:hypothetical protein K474DRAFT_1657199 [Panus rudis PR-1116 ss-1]
MTVTVDNVYLLSSSLLASVSLGILIWAFRRLLKASSAPTEPRKVKQSPDSEDGEWKPVSFTYPEVTPFPGDIASTKPIPYRPFKWGEYHVTMGIRSMPWDDWIELDCQFEHYSKIRERRIKDRGDHVLCTLPATPGKVAAAEPAARELLYELAEYLSRRYPNVYKVTRHSPSEKSVYGWYDLGDIKDITIVPMQKTFNLAEGDPMVLAALLTQDDLAIMIEGSDGKYYLQGGAILNAGTWRLEDKLGMPLDEIHISGGVPRFKSKLDLSMGRFFKRLPVDKPVIRNNYSFQVVNPKTVSEMDPSELAWSNTMKGNEDLVEEGVRWLRDINGNMQKVEVEGEKKKHAGYGGADLKASGVEVTPETVWMRTERQTLRRLPKTGAIIFTIRVYQTPIVDLVKEPGVPGRLASAIKSWPDDVAEYKAKYAFEGILGFLEACHEQQVEQGVLSRDEPKSNAAYPY